jgi:hypothetical protein
LPLHRKQFGSGLADIRSEETLTSVLGSYARKKFFDSYFLGDRIRLLPWPRSRFSDGPPPEPKLRASVGGAVTELKLSK